MIEPPRLTKALAKDRDARYPSMRDAAADHLPVHPSQDELGALPHRVDQVREPQEEAGAALDVGDRGQLGEGRARAERTRALASKHDHARPWLLAQRRDPGRQLGEEDCRQGVPLGMPEGHAADAVHYLRGHAAGLVRRPLGHGFPSPRRSDTIQLARR